MQKRVGIIVAMLLVALTGCAKYGLHGLKVHETPRIFNRTANEENAAYGDVSASYEWGLAYIKGQDGEKSYTRGTALLCKAAERGHTHAMMALADFYHSLSNNYPLPPSSDQMYYTPPYDAVAYAWYLVAECNGEEEAKKRRLDLKEQFNVEATLVARAMAEDFPQMPCIYPLEKEVGKRYRDATQSRVFRDE